MPNLLHEFLLGTDTLGRDLFSRILYGARVSLLVGFVATAVALAWCKLGIIAGYFGGRVDSVMMRIVDVLYISIYYFYNFINGNFWKKYLALVCCNWSCGVAEWQELLEDRF